ncbi:helix-turn-helix domain-containing protein [Haloprofundus salilacus]|uniref:helix-turn-helix domain-containing protein n=1 Tax=Haloprofundus salilacus TaxID=2876190 RepID=UPI001CCE7B48|nr:helix-turn-helix domain-containing protein [Haloprofundus salilacus]
MAIEASFTVDVTEFPLRRIFEELPDATVELDRLVSTNRETVPYFWVHADGVNETVSRLADNGGVETITVIDEVGDQLLLRVLWDFSRDTVLTAFVETDVDLVSGIGEKDRWTFEVRSTTQEAISEFQAYCRDHGIPVKLSQLHALSTLAPDQEYDLTEGQRKALMLAYTSGYFDSPRGATQQDIADALGITRQAVSSRLQRGTRRLIASTLATPN